jgi:hypothetical protein
LNGETVTSLYLEYFTADFIAEITVVVVLGYISWWVYEIERKGP